MRHKDPVRGSPEHIVRLLPKAITLGFVSMATTVASSTVSLFLCKHAGIGRAQIDPQFFPFIVNKLCAPLHIPVLPQTVKIVPADDYMIQYINPMIFPASMSRRVTCRSSLLGYGSPEG